MLSSVAPLLLSDDILHVQPEPNAWQPAGLLQGAAWGSIGGSGGWGAPQSLGGVLRSCLA